MTSNTSTKSKYVSSLKVTPSIIFTGYKNSGFATRVLIVPSIISTILAYPAFFRLEGPSLLGNSLFGLVIVLIFLQNAFSYIEKRAAEETQKRFSAFRILVEALNSVIDDKTEKIKSSLRYHKGNPTRVVRSSANKMRPENSVSAINKALNTTMLTYVRQYRGFANANVVTSFLRPNKSNGFDIVNCFHSAGVASIYERTKKLQQTDQQSFGCYLWNATTTNMNSSGDVRSLAEAGMFNYFDEETESRHLKSMVGFRVDIGGVPKFLWMIDADKIGAFPDRSNHRDDDSIIHLNEIFVAFATRIKYEYYFGCVADNFEELMERLNVL